MAAQVPNLRHIYFVTQSLHNEDQVALKRQQAAEDAIALGLRAVATGDHRSALPQGPIVGLVHLFKCSHIHSTLLNLQYASVTHCISSFNVPTFILHF